MNTPSDGQNKLSPAGAEALLDVIQKLSLAKDIETVMYIVRKATRRFTNSDGATFVLQRS